MGNLCYSDSIVVDRRAETPRDMAADVTRDRRMDPRLQGVLVGSWESFPARIVWFEERCPGPDCHSCPSRAPRHPLHPRLHQENRRIRVTLSTVVTRRQEVGY